jgi:hypothetical protein
MLPPTIIEPQVLILASSVLRPHVIAVALSSTQVRKCGFWFRRRHVAHNQSPHGDLHLHKMHESWAVRRQERLAALAQKRNRSFVGNQDRQDKDESDKGQTATEEVNEGNWSIIWHQKMAERQQEMLRRWVEKDPYDVLFGWSNRLRRGIKFDKHTARMRKELEDMISASEKVNGIMANIWASSAESKTAASETEKRPVEKAPSTTQSTINSKDTTSSSMTTPKVSEAEFDGLREYDPITNRMIRKSDKGFSHYGQDLDTEVDIPVKLPKQKFFDISATRGNGSPSVADVITELRQYKSQLLQDQAEKTGSQTIGFEKSISEVVTPEREKLEKSFAQLHANNGTSTREELGTAAKSKNVEPEVPKTDPGASIYRSQELKDLSERLGKLGSRLSDIGDSFGSRLRSVQPPMFEKAQVFVTENERELADSSTIPYASATPQKETAKLSVTGDESAGLTSNSSRHQREVDRMEGEIADLDKALSNIGPGSLRFDLARQRRELVRLTEELKKDMLSLPVSKNTDQGVQKLKQTPKRSSKGDIFPMIFGEKPVTPIEPEKKSDIGSQQLETEIQRQKEAMAVAEDIKPELQNQRLNDSELVKTIQEIYEKRYGTIAAEDQPEKIMVEEQSVPMVPSITNVKPVALTPPTDPLPTPPSTPSPLNTPPQNAVYTVLAYDPSTSEVSSTTLSAPVSSSDTPLPITVALTQLGEPAKFLPHLRLLGNHGTAVSVTKNLLVLRTLVAPSTTEPDLAHKGNATSTATEGNEFFRRDRAVETEKTRSFASGEFGKGSAPRRVEQVFSGRAPHERWDRSEEQGNKGWIRWMKRLSIVSGVGVAILYVGGVTAGLRRVNVPKESEEK